MKSYLSHSLASLLATMVLLSVSSVAFAAPDSDTLEFWLDHDSQSTVEVSHDAWQEILDKYLDADHASGVNRFNYEAVENEDRKALNRYLDSLQAIDPRSLSRDEQLAYWINFYNALTVQVVLDEFPVDSIRNIRFLTSPFGPWDKNLAEVQGQDLSLNDIEHGILRPIWQDPRIHFAVNCASIGCPNLVDEAFTAANADELMTEAANDFIGHTRGVEVKGDTVILSSIFDWYGSDFGANKAEITDYLVQFMNAGEATKLKGVTKFEYQYDWNLNQP